ncbi:hypothetical protein [Streptomyces sp. A 4/2]|uniref:hypothetical protein n=1 Tax=Streptomyces sp. A 4/2 TaxID=2934314 RepID=UPI002024CD6D|nr:hypothetical protein [Streptomyces sp. A 4/2]
MATYRPSDAALTGLALDPHARHVPSWMYIQDFGPGGLVTHGHDFRAFLEHGEVLLDPYGRFPGVPTN